MSCSVIPTQCADRMLNRGDHLGRLGVMLRFAPANESNMYKAEIRVGSNCNCSVLLRLELDCSMIQHVQHELIHSACLGQSAVPWSACARNAHASWPCAHNFSSWEALPKHIAEYKEVCGVFLIVSVIEVTGAYFGASSELCRYFVLSLHIEQEEQQICYHQLHILAQDIAFCSREKEL